jgi:trans-aconitate methyltransferase
MDRTKYWDTIYSTKAHDSVSWHESIPTTSLELVADCAPEPTEGIIDVGGGASTLVDGLLARGHTDLCVLDVSAEALATSKARLGEAADSVTWEVADLTLWEPPRTFSIWHDRVVLHFLGTGADRDAYRSVIRLALEPGGWAILATFSPEGPQRCSGLDVTRYSGEEIAAMLGDGFRLERSFTRIHTTPSGAEQQFQWAVLRRESG